MLFGKNRVLKLAVVNKIVRAQRVQFGNQRPISEKLLTCDRWVSCQLVLLEKNIYM